MELPVMPPVSPMLAKAVKTIPTGELSYEPKWDGLSACTNYGAPAAPSAAASSGAGSGAGGGAGAAIKTADIPVGGGNIFADPQAVVT